MSFTLSILCLLQIRVRVANADLSVSRGNVEQALIMLRSITPEQPYYIQVIYIKWIYVFVKYIYFLIRLLKKWHKFIFIIKKTRNLMQVALGKAVFALVSVEYFTQYIAEI